MLGYIWMLKQVHKLENTIGHTGDKLNYIDRRTYKTYVIVAHEDCSSDFSTPENERKV